MRLGSLFKGLPTQQPPHLLRSVICYFGHHYQAYALSEELNDWLLFDDVNIAYVGDWQAVQASIKSNRSQPSVLFYQQQLSL